jgi:phosphate transport system protein
MAEIHEDHTVRSYDQELDQLSVNLLQLGGLVMDQTEQAVAALTGRDEELARTVIEREKEVNAYDTRIEEMAVQLLAKRAPVGSDLRTVLAMLKAGTDLERAGDEAKKVAKLARSLTERNVPPAAPLVTRVESMTALITAMLRDVLSALDNSDEALAVTVAVGDKQVDREYRAALASMHEYLKHEGRDLHYVADAILVLKALERIGDHAKNIAKYVVFVVQGRDMRHVKAKHLHKEIGDGPSG